MSVQAQKIAVSLTGLTGDIGSRLSVIKAAGFEKIELDAAELSKQGNLRVVEGLLQNSGLKLAAYKELKDFTGHKGHVMRYKMQLAQANLKMMTALDCSLLIVTPSAVNKTTNDEVVAQLRAISTLAMLRGVRVGYRPLPWSDHAYDYETAYRLVEQAGNANLGLVVDSFHNLTDLNIDELFTQVPGDKVFLIRLSDFAMSTLYTLEDKIEVDHHQRLFPGEGGHSSDLTTLLCNCQTAGYKGDFILSANDDRYRFASLETVITKAAKSRDWVLSKLNR
jgi:2-keto-myo-inositol isomerase